MLKNVHLFILVYNFIYFLILRLIVLSLKKYLYQDIYIYIYTISVYYSQYTFTKIPEYFGIFVKYILVCEVLSDNRNSKD